MLSTNDVIEKEQQNEKLAQDIIFIDENFLENNSFVSVRANQQRKSINAEFRAIKHEVITNAASESGNCTVKNLAMLTSAHPNEGKTYCSINLALMLSLEKNKSVLLVDADVLNPSIDKILKIKNKLGLIDYLNGDVKNVESVIYESSIPNLKILPAGTINSLSYELLESEKMSNLTEMLSKQYKDSIVVFDGPPVLGVIETISLSKLVGQVLIVTEHNKTKISDINDISSKLYHNFFTGVIINKSTDNKLGHYGYGYYY